jgi:hypothetical protein
MQVLNSLHSDRNVWPLVNAVQRLIEFLMNTNMLIDEPYTLPCTSLLEEETPPLASALSWLLAVSS